MTSKGGCDHLNVNAISQRWRGGGEEGKGVQKAQTPILSCRNVIAQGIQVQFWFLNEDACLKTEKKELEIPNSVL